MVKRRKTTVAPPPVDSSLGSSMSLLAGAWTADVIWYLRSGSRCFTELKNDIAGISPKMLTSRLRKLERDGVILRGTKATSPPTVWYALTPAGLELAGVLENVVGIAGRLRLTQGNVSQARS